MLRAEEYLGRVGVGVTMPRLVRADDGRVYVVKLKDNRLGTKVLVNEFIAARIGERLGLAFPESGLIQVTEEFVMKYRRRLKDKVSTGVHFASLYLRGSKYVHYYHMPRVRNKAMFAGVILFDHFMHNADRTLNSKNMLVLREEDGYRLYAIDNSHLFGSGRWLYDKLVRMEKRLKINRRRAYGILLKRYLKREDFTPYIEKLQMISDEDFAQILRQVPEEWALSEQESAALLQFWQRRRELTQWIADQIMSFIPNVDGGS